MRSLKILPVLALASLLLTTGPTHAAEPLDTNALDKALDQYWGKRDDQTHVQGVYAKDSRHEFTLFFGVVPNEKFFSYLPLGGRWDFFFSEHFGIEVFGSYMVSLDGELKDFLEQNSLFDILSEKPQELVWEAGAAFVWNPIHGKLAIFTEKLFHFDFQISLGAGVIGTTFQNPETGETDSKIDVAGNLGLGVRFYITDQIAIRADYKQFLYGAESGIAVPAEFTVGVSFWTGK